ncbi:MAG: ATP-dependent helicase/nuclease subunit, partial [Clostridiales bacterium]|nr:ATP-dependent helicase/nuclease subunit [Clostridiales bacterium]
GYELRFSYLDDLESVQIPLSNQANMNLVGRIDRVDICEKETELYVKVVDYKSGKKTFRIQDFYYGLELQLVVYMETMVEKFARDQADKTVIPAGIFYYNLDDPIVDKVDAPLYEDTLLKELRVNGLVNEKKEVIGALDASFVEDGELKPSVKSNVIPVETLKSGGFSKNSSVASAEQFDNIMRYARKKMEQLGKQMMEGQCSVAPYQLGDRTACEYCMYGSVCAFDKKAGSQFRVLEELDKEEILRRVEKGLEGGEEI